MLVLLLSGGPGWGGWSWGGGPWGTYEGPSKEGQKCIEGRRVANHLQRRQGGVPVEWLSESAAQKPMQAHGAGDGRQTCGQGQPPPPPRTMAGNISICTTAAAYAHCPRTCASFISPENIMATAAEMGQANAPPAGPAAGPVVSTPKDAPTTYALKLRHQSENARVNINIQTRHVTAAPLMPSQKEHHIPYIQQRCNTVPSDAPLAGTTP